MLNGDVFFLECFIFNNVSEKKSQWLNQKKKTLLMNAILRDWILWCIQGTFLDRNFFSEDEIIPHYVARIFATKINTHVQWMYLLCSVSKTLMYWCKMDFSTCFFCQQKGIIVVHKTQNPLLKQIKHSEISWIQTYSDQGASQGQNFQIRKFSFLNKNRTNNHFGLDGW